MADRTYSREEMEEIFRRAAEHTQFQESGADAIKYEDLVAAAREVGIDPSSVAEVARKVEAERGAVQRQADDDAVVRHELAERRHRARSSLLTYTIVCTFLAVLDWMTPGGPWVQWVALIWGLFVALGLGRALLAPSARDRERILRREQKKRAKREREERRARAAEEWKARLSAQQEAIRQELRQQEEKRRQREHQRREANRELERASREFERAVEDGVTQLLTVLARRIGEAAKDDAGPRGDFGDFVRREKQRASGVPAQAEGPRVRAAEPSEPSRPTDTSEEDETDARARERDRRARR
ncbi:MAG: 2TM domain-containing protein [Sandaracinaceae bacterium]|jgi:hypothetical protein|nr:2TM domain-containing protein [Sandaracinaceae bacterium]